MTTQSDPNALAKSLAERGIMTAGGSFYADRALEAQGVAPDPGVLRLSFVHYTAQADLDKLMTALDDLL
jgi:selenocysteine lyase/cysteine desulfurase